MIGFAFLAAVVGLVLAAAFWFQWQSAARAVLALRAEADAARKEAEAARAEQRKAAEELKAQKALAQETREKLNEARKKAQEGKTGKAQSRGAREAELEEDLAHARRLLEEAHAAEQQARTQLQTAKSAEAQARSDLERAQAKLRELPAPPPPVAAAPEFEAQRKQLDAARTELERQVQQAERNAREAKRHEQELREEVKKQKGRAETNNRVYLVTKGELDLVKERLAQAEHKLWQAGIPLAPPTPKERPKATGPAAADRPQEAAAAPTPNGAEKT
jgi:DNA repair exonuclease SbcCD ATPase subunit